MTDNEIVKALELCCVDSKNCLPYCRKCPLYDERNCTRILRKNSFDLINRQKAKIEALKMDNKQLENDNFNANMNCEHLQAENERLKKVLKTKSRELKNKIKTCNELVEEKVMFPKKIKTAKAEAYKEFAERLKENLTFHENDCCEFVPWVDCRNIDNLLKEMVKGK